MEIKAFKRSSCCGGVSYSITLTKSIDDQFANAISNKSFKVLDHFKNSGIFYAESDTTIITGPLKGNKLQVTFKGKPNNSDDLFDNLKIILNEI